MLKAHQACVDLEKNVLRIQRREVKFLSEHELPDKARDSYVPGEIPAGPVGSSHPSSQSPQRRSQPPFPGSGNTLGAAPSSREANASSRHPESTIQILMDLGATREQAISTLDAANGNVDVAASLLF